MRQSAFMMNRDEIQTELYRIFYEQFEIEAPDPDDDLPEAHGFNIGAAAMPHGITNNHTSRRAIAGNASNTRRQNCIEYLLCFASNNEYNETYI